VEFADQEVAEFVARLNDGAGGGFNVAAMRADGAKRSKTRPAGPDLAVVRELKLGGCRAREYRPFADSSPTILYLHGGGWTIGDLDTHDRLCRVLAARTGATVVALEYRLAPEHPWPAAVADAVAALRALAGRGTVAVAGDSAGGTVATLACLRVRDEDAAALPALQVLLCANTDLTGSSDSMREKAHGCGLDVEAVEFFNIQWVPDRSPVACRGPQRTATRARDHRRTRPAS
jgi:acetyl esterase